MGNNINNQFIPNEIKICKHCKSAIPKLAKVCPVCKKSQSGNAKWIIIGVIVFLLFCSIIGGNSNSKNEQTNNTDSKSKAANTSSEAFAEDSISKDKSVDNVSAVEEKKSVEEKESIEEKESVTKYYPGETFQNKYLKVTFTECGEFTGYNTYNAPPSGYKIIYTNFEFENISDSDQTVMYTNFHGYADGYEVSQNYSPAGTGLDFNARMSAGRKGTGVVAFEVPENAEEVEIEFDTNFWTSENVIFVYQ